MSFIENLKIRAKEELKTIILAEGNDERHIIAAKNLQEEKNLKHVILVGDEKKIITLSKEYSLKLDDFISIVDPKTSKNKDKYIEKLFNNRKHKDMTLEEAKNLIENHSIYTAAAMVSFDEADGMVGGALYATGDVIKSILFLIGLKKGLKTLSSVFFMVHPNKEMFENGIFCFADCAVIPAPTPEQLADIAESSASSFRGLVGAIPKVAMLSFSSKGSASHPLADNVKMATDILDERKVDFVYDGEIQFDTAMVPQVSNQKAPNSPLKGEANVFIFPDLGAGNICCKAVQRLAGCSAIGPMLQGTAKPANDLSRGCSAQDIADVAILTALQAQSK